MTTSMLRSFILFVLVALGAACGNDIAVVAGTWTPTKRTITLNTCPIADDELKSLETSLVIEPVDAAVAEVRQCADPTSCSGPAETLGFEKDVVVWDAVRERELPNVDCVLTEKYMAILVPDEDELLVFEDIELERKSGIECPVLEGDMREASGTENVLEGCDVQLLTTFARAAE